MAKFNKGDVVLYKMEDGETIKLYYIDEFDVEDEGEKKTVLVCGGQGEETLYIESSEAIGEYASFEEKVLNVLVDIAQSMKHNSGVLGNIANAVAPSCEGCGKLLSNHDHEDEEDDDDDEDADDGFEN